MIAIQWFSVIFAHHHPHAQSPAPTPLVQPPDPRTRPRVLRHGLCDAANERLQRCMGRADHERVLHPNITLHFRHGAEWLPTARWLGRANGKLPDTLVRIALRLDGNYRGWRHMLRFDFGHADRHHREPRRPGPGQRARRDHRRGQRYTATRAATTGDRYHWSFAAVGTTSCRPAMERPSAVNSRRVHHHHR